MVAPFRSYSKNTLHSGRVVKELCHQTSNWGRSRPKISRNSIFEWPLSLTYSLSSQQRLSGVNFINILRTNFSYEHCFGSFFYVHVTREKLPKQCSYKKFVRKMLMKLTTGRFYILVFLSRSIFFSIILCWFLFLWFLN